MPITKAFIIVLSVVVLGRALVNGQTAVKPASHLPNFFAPYTPRQVPEPRVANSGRLDSLLRNGRIMLSLEDAIALALENNLDLAIARYNLAIADTDVLRAKSGNSVRGVATGLVQGTPGGGIGGFGAGAPGAGAGGTSGGAGGAGTGASGLVQSTLGTGAPLESYDPTLVASMNIEHSSAPQSNIVTTGVSRFQQNSGIANFSYSQAFATGTQLLLDFNNSRATNNALFSTLVPEIRSDFRFTFRQHLLSGFGLGPNLRFVHIAKNNREISDVAFRNQVVATVVQIENIYWDLVSAFETVRVNEQSVALAEKTVSDDRAQVKIGNLAPIEVTRAESELAQRREDLLIAQTQLQLQQLLMKNAITRNLSDRVLASAPVIPTNLVALPAQEPVVPVEDLIQDALVHRPELVQTRIDLTNRDISRKGARNALLPTVDFVAWYGGSGLAGVQNRLNTEVPPSSIPTTGFTNAFTQLVHTDFPDYAVGLSVNLPIRNRGAQADQVRSELEYRQAQMRSLQLQNQVGIEVRNAQFAVEQNRARVDTARQARDLASQTFDIERKRFALGASTSNDVLHRQRDLAQAESTLVNAMSAYAKSRVELDRSTGSLLSRYGIVLDEAESGNVKTLPTVPDVQRQVPES
ncbi:MAG TPA: TolC family protein, partial [Pyrinomonadaceae bacterium]|nr:TolC family protein [Pyrinomonadaceae bacterium]